jgi:hypothetical protein
MPKDKESWIHNKWRPTIAWVYVAICAFDFIVGPIVWTILQGYSATGLVAQQWVPLTLGSGGLFHAAMGAILGVTSWSRGKEKLAGVAGEYHGEEDVQRRSEEQR